MNKGDGSDDGNKEAPASVDIHPETKAGSGRPWIITRLGKPDSVCRKPAPISRVRIGAYTIPNFPGQSAEAPFSAPRAHELALGPWE